MKFKFVVIFLISFSTARAETHFECKLADQVTLFGDDICVPLKNGTSAQSCSKNIIAQAKKDHSIPLTREEDENDVKLKVSAPADWTFSDLNSRFKDVSVVVYEPAKSGLFGKRKPEVWVNYDKWGGNHQIYRQYQGEIKETVFNDHINIENEKLKGRFELVREIRITCEKTQSENKSSVNDSDRSISKEEMTPSKGGKTKHEASGRQ